MFRVSGIDFSTSDEKDSILIEAYIGGLVYYTRVDEFDPCDMYVTRFNDHIILHTTSEEIHLSSTRVDVSRHPNIRTIYELPRIYTPDIPADVVRSAKYIPDFNSYRRSATAADMHDLVTIWSNPPGGVRCDSEIAENIIRGFDPSDIGFMKMLVRILGYGWEPVAITYHAVRDFDHVRDNGMKRWMCGLKYDIVFRYREPQPHVVDWYIGCKGDIANSRVFRITNHWRDSVSYPFIYVGYDLHML